MVDNYAVAIMNMVNELADRHGIRPFEFVAVVDTSPENSHEVELRFEAPPKRDQALSFDRMLRELGVRGNSDDMQSLRGSEETIYASLETALRRAPKRSRPR